MPKKQEKSDSKTDQQRTEKGTANALTESKKKLYSRNNFQKPKYVSAIKLTPQRKRMIRETINALISSNFNNERASKLLDISVQALYDRFKRYPQIKEQTAFYNKQIIELAKQKIEQNALISADSVIDLADGARSEKVKLEANLELLDRAGISKPNTNVQVNILNDLRKDKEQFNL
jgi:hypothetical protein